jgi:hypothetical protein
VLVTSRHRQLRPIETGGANANQHLLRPGLRNGNVPQFKSVIADDRRLHDRALRPATDAAGSWIGASGRSDLLECMRCFLQCFAALGLTQVKIADLIVA